MKKIFLLLLTACLLAASARAQELVPIATSCMAGNPFTISIPFKLPPNDTVFYRWYCNGQLSGVEGVATQANGKISYTIPADSTNYGRAEAYFTYRLNDDCDEWTRSPRYVVSFVIICPPAPGAINFSAYSCSGGVSTSGVVNFAAYACSGGISNAGAINFSAYSCSGGVSNAGVVSFSAYSCSNGVSNAGAISFAPSN